MRDQAIVSVSFISQWLEWVKTAKQIVLQHRFFQILWTLSFKRRFLINLAFRISTGRNFCTKWPQVRIKLWEVYRLVNSDLSESLAANLRNKSPEYSAEYCREKIQHNEQFLNIILFANRKHFAERSHFVERSHKHQWNIRCGFKNDYLLQELKTYCKSVRTSVLGGTPAPREHHAWFNNGMRS